MNESSEPKVEETSQTEAQQEELSTYQQLRQRLKTILGETRETVDADALRRAIDKAAADLRAAGEHSKEAISAAVATLKKDLTSTVEAAKPRLEEELAAYDKLRERVRTKFAQTKESFSSETVKQYVERAGDELKDLGGYSRETITRVGATLKKELSEQAAAAKPRLDELGKGTEHAFEVLKERGGAFWQELSEDAGRVFEHWRDKGGAFLAVVARAVGEWSAKFGDRVDASLIYRAGESTHGGAFTCTSCGTALTLKKPGHLPPCPKCHKMEFRRS